VTRVDALITRLQHGPATTAELAQAAGCGSSYVAVALRRIASRGVPVYTIGSPGSHRGCLRFMAASPAEEPRRCWRCGYPLARDHHDAVCSPCERALVDAELAAVV
jgi:hypothetical protein